MKNKTRKKSLKKQTKKLGGMEKGTLDGNYWKSEEGYKCVSCMDPKVRETQMVKMCTLGHGICKNCVKDFCRNSSRPQYLEQHLNPVKCPLCGEDITQRCLEVTKSRTLVDMVNLDGIPTYDQLYPPSVVQQMVQASQVNPQAAPPLTMQDIDLNLLQHLIQEERTELERIIELIRATMDYGIKYTLTHDTYYDTLESRLRDINTYFYSDGSPKPGNHMHTYDAHHIKQTYIQSQGPNARDYSQELRALSRRIKGRLLDLVEINDQQIEQIKQNMLIHIFNETMINSVTIQTSYFTGLIYSLRGPPRNINMSERVPVVINGQEQSVAMWEFVNAILNRIIQILSKNIETDVSHVFASYEGEGGSKKNRRKTKKTKRKRRKWKKK